MYRARSYATRDVQKCTRHTMIRSLRVQHHIRSIPQSISDNNESTMALLIHWYLKRNQPQSTKQYMYRPVKELRRSRYIIACSPSEFCSLEYRTAGSRCSINCRYGTSDACSLRQQSTRWLWSIRGSLFTQCFQCMSIQTETCTQQITLHSLLTAAQQHYQQSMNDNPSLTVPVPTAVNGFTETHTAQRVDALQVNLVNCLPLRYF